MSPCTYVFVPGAGGMASFWTHVRERLTSRDVASVAVDLPGPDPEAGLPEYVDLIVEAAQGFDDVVLVAQSLGGFSASWAASTFRPQELVLVNAMIPLPGETAGQWWEASGSVVARAANDVAEGRDPDGPFDADVYFFHDVPPAMLATLTDDPQDEADAVFATPWGLDAWPDIPTRVIAGEHDRLFPVEFQRRLARERLGVEIEVVPGGHLAALSRPDELVDALLRPRSTDRN
ncbi:alpha/beta fold hydrolase [Aeromicrobium sp. UC242_57]|uniref:alpha/beta fold hydrolase n=1 Tax=Aeromicrobium sp. UC242_57 TaxID=3374624 RepID=UPI0037AF9EF2